MSDFSNYFLTAATLFPVMLLTKTVNSGTGGSDGLGDVEYLLHATHVILCFAGEAIALYGIWGEASGSDLAIVVAVLLGCAGITLFIDLLPEPSQRWLVQPLERKRGADANKRTA